MSIVELQALRFSNMFSYGEDNEINLNKRRITQLTAPNGSGKSSISLILQEVLFNKNSKGVKKTDIINRWSKSKNWDASLDFSADGKQYEVSVKRTGAQTKVKLLENGVDISEHKVLDTYKKISDIIGLDYTVFSQLTYQSSTDLLDFLKATDTNRKKFLINLFNLEKYIEIGDSIKVVASAVDKQLTLLQGELKSVESFLNSSAIPEPKFEQAVPEIDESLYTRLAQVKEELANINNTCKKIDKNNMYLSEQQSLKFEVGLTKPEPFAHIDEFQTLKFDLTVAKNEIARLTRERDDLKINDTCPSCGQTIDNSHIKRMKQELQASIDDKQSQYDSGIVKYRAWKQELDDIANKQEEYAENQKKIDRFEQLTQLIDLSIPTAYPDAQALTSESKELEIQIKAQDKKLKEVTEYNKQVSAHNAKIQGLIEQKNEFLIRQESLKSDILTKSGQATSLSILKKAFSTSGIVAFKLENLTKELENSINRYLSMLSDGQFQVEFTLDKEKLNISVINNGITTPIETVSGGEFSRIQTSILLAIRNLLSKLGGSSVNLLFLDEITGVLDDEGKEKLVEVLQQENDLNVFLISHDFTHPLIDKINIVKENNISSIQY